MTVVAPSSIRDELGARWRAQVAVDRVRLPTSDLFPRWSAWCWIAATYALGWGVSTVFAFQVLGGAPLPPVTASGATNGIALSLIVVVLCAVLVLYTVTSRRAPLVRPMRPLQRATLTLKTTAVSYLGSTLGWFTVALLAAVLSAPVLTRQPTPPDLQLVDTIASMMAGPAEELALVLLPVVLLRAAGYRWPVIYVTAVMLRVPFHMYYGWAALGFTVWALLAVALYRRTGSILGPILAHSLHNLLITLPLNYDYIVIGGSLIAVAILGVTFAREPLSHHRSETPCPPVDGTS